MLCIQTKCLVFVTRSNSEDKVHNIYISSHLIINLQHSKQIRIALTPQNNGEVIVSWHEVNS